MATKYFLGTADNVAQRSTVEITAYDVGTTYKVTIGGKTISTVGTGGTVATTAAALQALLAASLHPYFAAITWTVDTATITGTAKVDSDGRYPPFVATSSVSGGTGTIGAVATPTAGDGPNYYSAANMSDGSLLADGDTLILRNCAENLCWGLDQSGIAPAQILPELSYTGRIGLVRETFATSADGETSSAIVKPEYRETYWTFDNIVLCRIGENNSPGAPSGSPMIKIHVKSVAASIFEVCGGAAVSAQPGLPAYRFLSDHADTDVFVRSAPAGVGVACDVPGETSLIRKISVSDLSGSSKVYTGEGCTVVTWEQTGGDNVCMAAATLTTMTIHGGTLRTEGDFTVTTANVWGGVLYANQIKTAGNAFTTLNIRGGLVDTTGSRRARTAATVNLYRNGSIRRDGTVFAMTAFNVEPSEVCTLSAA